MSGTVPPPPSPPGQEADTPDRDRSLVDIVFGVLALAWVVVFAFHLLNVLTTFRYEIAIVMIGVPLILVAWFPFWFVLKILGRV